MVYVMSDLHGCYDKYIKMIKKINLKNDDILYILGDVTDRGDDGIKILFDMMKRPNIVPVLGNHDLMAYCVLKKLNVEITEENYESHLDKKTITMFEDWMFNGGISTFSDFVKLSSEEREDILSYFREFDAFEELKVGDNEFLLVHGGYKFEDREKDLYECDLHDLVWGKCDYDKEYYPDKYLVTGHTPTFEIDDAYKGRIYKKNNHIAIDCGVVFCGKLGCVCLDTFEEFYVE